jgi:pimeloyl-ACP methyl ester carboxylesterase
LAIHTCKKKKLKGMKRLSALYFTNEGLRLAYTDQGKGSPVLLVHGFASNQRVNWFETGWVDFLLQAGRRVITFDHRGHGQSDKPHDPKFYEPLTMASDATALLDHLGIKHTDVMGYSMGARVAAFLAISAPQRICSLVLAGVGLGITHTVVGAQAIIAALEAPSLQDVTTPQGRMFRRFAEQTQSDLTALAACMRAENRNVIKDELARISLPVLVAAGTEDELAATAHDLARLIPDAKTLDIAGRDHMRAVGDIQYKQGVLAFWNSLPPCKGR